MPRTLSSARHKRLAELLIEYREQSDLTQTEVARSLRRYQPFISAIEAGQRRVDVVELLDIAKAIGFDPSELLRRLQAVGPD